MAANALNLQIVVDNSGLVSGLTVATKGVDGAAQQIRTSFKSMGDSAAAASDPIRGLGDHIRSFAAEERAQGRLGSFLAGQISEIGLAGTGAAGEIAGFISAFAFGGGMGVAAESVKMLFKAFSDSGGEVKKATADAIEAVTKLHEKVEDYLGSLRKETEIEKMLRKDIGPLRKEEGELTQQLTKAEQVLGAAKREVAAIDQELHKTAYANAVIARDVATDEYNRILKLLTAKREELRLSNQEVGTAADAKAASDKKDLRSQEVIDLAQWRAFQLQEWKKYYDAQTADAAKALQDQFADLDKAALEMAKFRAEQFQEDHKHYEKVTADTLAVLQAEADKEIKLAKEKARAETEAAKQFGDAFGAAFAGIVSGTESVSKAFASMASAAIKAVIDVAIKTIQANAVAAAAEAATSQAGIPIIGPILAIAALASMESLISGLLSSVPSAAGGYDIPAGVNPRVQLHEQEMVLPRPIAEGIRNMVGSGGSGGGDVHVHILAMDGLSVRRVVESDDFQRAMREARRNGRV